MSLDTAVPRSRRALLAGSLGALAALAAQAIGRPLSVSAAGNGQALVLGSTNSCGTQGTTISNLTSADADFAHGKTGVWGASPSSDGFGIQGYVSGTAGMGVHGFTSGHSSQVGVDGDTRDGNGEGIAVRARTKNGIGVYASAVGGYAIQANGLTVFSRSGKVAFAAGQSSKTITGFPIIPDSLVVATIQGDVAGTWVRGVTLNDAGDSFTIRLNRAAPKALKVGWFIVN
ncbi:MAG: hypothetical protein U0869_00265 [Chloroflexota bacterium]